MSNPIGRADRAIKNVPANSTPLQHLRLITTIKGRLPKRFYRAWTKIGPRIGFIVSPEVFSIGDGQIMQAMI